MTNWATYTNAGLTLLATARQSNGADVAVTYVGIGLGCGTLASALTSGTAYTSLTLAAALTANLAIGQTLVLINNAGNSVSATVASPGASAGATSIPINSLTPTNTYSSGSGVTTAPAATDTALFDETYRIAAIPGSPGANPGESLNNTYFDPSAPSATYVEVGYFGGTASATPGTGTLLARDAQLWQHTMNADSASFQLDTKLSLT
jgi:hypothetical protein